MNELFLKIVNMSISASWLVLAVLVLRLVLKRSPKWVNVLLWGIVALRLVIPFSFESALSLIPSAETIPANIEMAGTPTIDSGINIINGVVNPVIGQANTPAPGASINPLQGKIAILAAVWVSGVVVLLAYTAISYWRLRRKVSEATLLRDNIYQCELVASPFVLGIIKPRIYLSYQIDGQDLNHVVAHEQAHIRRKDHWWKPLGFLLLTIHWFNPLMWLAYVLLCRDIELACDEKVIKELGNEQRADYSQALLSCSVNRRMIAACPLAFGEVGVKERVKSVMNYRKPAFWVVVMSVAACVVVAVCFLTDPKSAENEIPDMPHSESPEVTPSGTDHLADNSAAAIDDPTQEQELTANAAQFPSEPLEFLFASGAGAWGTTLTLHPDGSFTGHYRDSEMGSSAQDHPNGICYVSHFQGSFSEIRQRNDQSWSMQITDLTTEQEVGTTWIEEGILYIASEAHGLAGGEEFILYAPGTPADQLSEDCRYWWPDWYLWSNGEKDLLDCWCICNVNTGHGFFTN